MIGIGKILGERYKINRLLGTGGMSYVYEGHDLILDRPVAVKVLRYDFHQNREALRRFQREALSATQLVHPNIVSVYDVDEEDGQQYIIMEFVQGTDLKQYIKEAGQVSPRDAVMIMSQVLSAIGLAHRNRIIHRDIKPQNLLIDHNQTIKVTDFGIAVALSDTSITQTNSLLGSVHYISPEQARGSVTTTKSDIYALGIVLYEMLSGEVPFDGESAVSVALKHFQETIPSLTERFSHIPQSLENVILKATAKEPVDRYDSCEEMMLDLETSLQTSRWNEPVFRPAAMLEETKVLQPITAKDIPVKEHQETTKKPENPASNRKKPTKKSNRKRGFLFLILAIIAAIGIWIAYQYANRPPEEIAVPEITNVTEREAIERIVAAGFEVGDVDEEYDDEVAEGFIISSTPGEGEMIQPGSTIDLVVSMGSEPFTLEDYTGENYQDVRDSLRDAGFQVEREDIYDEAETGTIVSQSLDEGEQVIPSETIITLTVSMGEETYTMEDLSGYDRDQVNSYVNQYGLTVSYTTENSDTIAEGLVISQSIQPQSNFTWGDELAIVLSAGNAEPEIRTFSKKVTIPFEAPVKPTDSSSSASSSPSSEEEPSNRIVIYMKDADHSLEEIFREFYITKTEETTLNFRVIGEGTGAYRVERDGKVILEETNLTE